MGDDFNCCICGAAILDGGKCFSCGHRRCEKCPIYREPETVNSLKQRIASLESELREARTCLGCKHYTAYDGDHGYSEMTPPSAPNIGCKKTHWDWDDPVKVSELKPYFLKARTCKDYAPPENSNG